MRYQITLLLMPFFLPYFLSLHHNDDSFVEVIECYFMAERHFISSIKHTPTNKLHHLLKFISSCNLYLHSSSLYFCSKQRVVNPLFITYLYLLTILPVEKYNPWTYSTFFLGIFAPFICVLTNKILILNKKYATSKRLLFLYFLDLFSGKYKNLLLCHYNGHYLLSSMTILFYSNLYWFLFQS